MKDYTPEEAQAEIAALYSDLRIICSVTPHGLRSEGPTGEKWNHHAFTYRFYRNQSVEFPWMQGTGVEQQAAPCEVLAAVCRDAEECRDKTFEEWAGDFGYDLDSRRAEKVYKTCRALKSELKALGISPTNAARFAELSAIL